MARIVGDGHDETKRAAVEALQWEIAARVLSLGRDVILENGFWSRTEREDFRSRAKAVGARTRIYFLDVPQDELRRRLKLRNAALPVNTFRVTEAQLGLWSKRFEPPTPEEL